MYSGGDKNKTPVSAMSRADGRMKHLERYCKSPNGRYCEFEMLTERKKSGLELRNVEDEKNDKLTTVSVATGHMSNC